MYVWEVPRGSPEKIPLLCRATDDRLHIEAIEVFNLNPLLCIVKSAIAQRKRANVQYDINSGNVEHVPPEGQRKRRKGGGKATLARLMNDGLDGRGDDVIII